MKIAFVTSIGLCLVCLTACSKAENSAAGVIGAKGVTITSGPMSVTCSTADGSFSARTGDKQFINKAMLEKSAGRPVIKTEKMQDNLGQGEAITVEFSNGYKYSIALYKDVPFVCVRSQVTNPGKEVLVIEKATPVTATLDLAKSPAALKVLGCDGLTAADKNRGSFMFLAIAEPQSRAGAVVGWLTSDRGSGEAMSKPAGQQVSVEAVTEYGKLRIKPGQTAQGEILAIGYFADATIGLEKYADAVAAVYQIKPKKTPSGYCTWYHTYGALDEQKMAVLADFCKDKLTKYGFGLLQIDDGWQSGDLPKGYYIPRKDFTATRTGADATYPNGFKPTVEKINADGMTAGLWMLPFGWDTNCPSLKDHQDWFVHRPNGKIWRDEWAGPSLDMTNPQAQEFLKGVISRMTKDWGFKYLKLDGLFNGMAVEGTYSKGEGVKPDAIGTAVFHNPDMTNVEAYRAGLKAVRAAAGDDVFILGCNIVQNMRVLGASWGILDGMRIGTDIKSMWKNILPCATMGSRLYFLHGRVWTDDPDCLMIYQGLKEWPVMKLEQSKAWASWIAVTGQLNLVSEWLPEVPDERIELIRRSMPNHGLCARPVDLFTSDIPRIWQLSADKGLFKQNVIGVFNWDANSPATIEIKLSDLYLPNGGKGQYVAFDYWDNKFIRPFEGSLTLMVPPASCKIIALQPLDNKPQIISTSRGINQGIIDLNDVKWEKQHNVLSGKCKVIGGEPYELRIFGKLEGGAWVVWSFDVSRQDRRDGVLFDAKHWGPEYRYTINSPDTREVSWSIGFSRGQE